MPEPASSGVLVVFTDFPSEEDSLIDEWYTREHLRSRVQVEGFVRGRRFEAIAGSPRYLAVYDTHSISVLGSQAYFDAGASPDEREREHVPKFRNTQRTVCTVTASAGDAQGSCAGFLSLKPDLTRAVSVRSWIARELLPELIVERGVVAAHLWETNADMLARASRGFVPDNSAVPTWLLVWESTRPCELASARDACLDSARLGERGATPQPGFGDYRLLMTLDH